MLRQPRIVHYVAAVGFLSALVLALAAKISPHPFPDIAGLIAIVSVGVLLEFSGIELRAGGGVGSFAFVTHLACGVLFGPFWGALSVGIGTVFSQIARRREPLRVVFNLFQRIICVGLSITAYIGLSGRIPPGFIVPGSVLVWDRNSVTDLLAFLVAAMVYFVSNSLLVSGAVAINTNRRTLDVWRTNTLWVLGWDIAASGVSLLAAYLYLRDAPGLRLNFVLLFLAIFVGNHLYGRIRELRAVNDKLERAHQSLEQNLREQLVMMVKSIEARDPYTSGHSRRVAMLSKTIALDLGLSADQVEEIENAALLHDVGKIHAEFAPLLQKEGRLTQEEWELMKTHAGKSAELVGLFTRFRGSVQESVRWHHERWDGKGYPDGLIGSAIPLGARIIMVSDTIDAMTTDRPYRKALTFEVVIEELLKYRGEQFDPFLVDVVTSSVSIRRLASDPSLLAHYELGREVRVPASPPLRSQKSLWDALRAGASARSSGS